MNYFILLAVSYLPHLLAYRDFSTHTPYDYARGDITEAKWSKKIVPTRIYLLARHGSRHLGDDEAIGMNDIIDKILSEMGVEDQPAWLRNWERPKYTEDKHLVPQGMLEHYHLAQRYKQRFPALFPDYYPTRYHVRSTFRIRTSQSASSFMFGLFEGTGPLDKTSTRDNVSTNGFQPVGIYEESRDEDVLLRFMDNCPAYENSPITVNYYSEVNKLQKSGHYKKLILDPISERLGFTLTVEDAENLYNLCTFEHVSPTESNNSSFCEMIPRSAFALFDYEKDLSRYYSSSYPNKLGYELSCVLLQDLLSQFNSEKPAAALRFAHSETVLPLVTLLGINKDEDIMYTWDKEEFWSRATKLSEVDPFAVNLGFVLFKNFSSGDEIIKVYLNEREVKVPVCESVEGCTKDELLTIVHSTQGKCDRSLMCFGANSTEDEISETTTETNDDSSISARRVVSEDLVEAAVAAKLADENKVLLGLNLFIVMTVLSGLCIVLIGFVGMNIKKIISDDGVSGYHKMPFLDS